MNLTKTRREAKILAAKILAQSSREAHQDSHREAIIPAAKIRNPSANLAKILAEKQIHSGKNLDVILPGVSTRLATGSKILGEIHYGNLATNFFWIEPNVYVLEIS